MHAEAHSICAGLLRQQAEQAATALGALPSITLADVKTHVSGPCRLKSANVLNTLRMWVAGLLGPSCYMLMYPSACIGGWGG